MRSTEVPQASNDPSVSADAAPIVKKKKPTIGRKTRMVSGAVGALLTVAGGTGYLMHEYPAQTVDVSRFFIGEDLTRDLIEEPGLEIKNKIDQWSFKLFGGEISPYEKKGFDSSLVVSSSSNSVYEEPILAQDIPMVVEPPPPPKPAPMIIPEVVLLQDPALGEGIWTTQGLPRSSPEDPLMVSTFIRPRTPGRPYARTDIILFDKRRIKLNIVGGTSQSSTANRNIKGPGIIAEEDKPNLLAAWNGGFELGHAPWGSYANGNEYKPLIANFAAVAVMADGTIKMGTWGQGDLVRRTDDMIAVRQNGGLLIENCELTEVVKRLGNSANNTFGLVDEKTNDYITSRSAIGLTKEGNFMVAVANSVSALELAQTLEAAGACTAMQTDINHEWVLGGFFYHENGTIVGSEKFSGNLKYHPNKYIDNQPESRDFMYLTLDETNFKP